MIKYEMIKQICEQIPETYKNKNTAYGDSFGKTVQKYGLIAALTRMSDKFNRMEALILGAENNVPDENLEDTLLDMASYSIMTLVELMLIQDGNKLE